MRQCFRRVAAGPLRRTMARRGRRQRALVVLATFLVVPALAKVMDLATNAAAKWHWSPASIVPSPPEIGIDDPVHVSIRKLQVEERPIEAPQPREFDFYRRLSPYQINMRTIGIVAVSLPFVLIIGGDLATGHVDLPTSISGLYYGPMRDILVGYLCTMGTLLISSRSGGLEDTLAHYRWSAGSHVRAVPDRPGVDRSDHHQRRRRTGALRVDERFDPCDSRDVPPGFSSARRVWRGGHSARSPPQSNL